MPKRRRRRRHRLRRCCSRSDRQKRDLSATSLSPSPSPSLSSAAAESNSAADGFVENYNLRVNKVNRGAHSLKSWRSEEQLQLGLRLCRRHTHTLKTDLLQDTWAESTPNRRHTLKPTARGSALLCSPRVSVLALSLACATVACAGECGCAIMPPLRRANHKFSYQSIFGAGAELRGK